PELDAKEYWYAMEVPYFARYAYAEKLALFEERGSITASTLPAMERLVAYLTADEIRTAEPLPETERALALAEFEGSEEAQPTRRARQPRRRASWSFSDDYQDFELEISSHTTGGSQEYFGKVIRSPAGEAPRSRVKFWFSEPGVLAKLRTDLESA